MFFIELDLSVMMFLRLNLRQIYINNTLETIYEIKVSKVYDLFNNMGKDRKKGNHHIF